MADTLSRSRGAIRDLALIVAGVLIALALDQTVQSFADRQREHQYLGALLEDIEADLDALRGPLGRELDQREAAAKLVIAGINGDSVDPRQMIAALDRAGHVRFFSPRRATFDDLISTGNLRLIRGREVRAALVTYYDITQLNSANELVRQEIWYGYRPTIQQVLDPLVLAEVTFIEGNNTANAIEAFAASIPRELAATGLNPVALQNSVAFRSGIGRALEYTYVQRRQHDGRIERAEATITIIRDALR